MSNTKLRTAILYQNKNRRWEDQTADPSKYPQGRFHPKPCRRCGTVFTPKAPSNLYCSQDCADYGVVTAYLKRSYGIDYAYYLAMLEQQKSVCALCGGEGFLMKGCHKLKLVVDHCHSTGRIRGLLCHNCNRALGLLQDNSDVIRKALGYLKGVSTVQNQSGSKGAKARRY